MPGPGTVRTRFAPSPSGFLHLGSARTALFSWAFARHHGGQFVLRLEDTDRERSSTESEEGLLDGLRWLGLDWDEGPHRQSERGERYAAAIDRLLASGQAYRCICTSAELEERKQATIAQGAKWTYDGRCREAAHAADCGPHVVRLRVEGGEALRWDDVVFGPSGQEASEIGDRIIRRSDGGALYNLAVVVDDIDMAITHVIRGADHMINTAVQLAIYRGLGEASPILAHLPLLVGEGGKKLSKRRDPVSIQRYRDDGYLPGAILSWLARLGWSHGDQEVFGLEEIAELFDLAAVGRSPGQVNFGKLEWQNQLAIAALSKDALFEAVRPFLERAAERPVEPNPGLCALLELLRERSHTLVEMAAQARWAVVDATDIEIDEKAARKHLKAGAKPILESLRRELAEVEDWTPAAIEQVFEAVRSEHGDVSMGKLAQPVRVALTGSSASPGIYDTVAALARERALARLDAAIERLPAPA